MVNQAIIGNVSLPISATSSIGYSADNKKYQALAHASGLAQGIYESVEAYQERIKKFQEERAKKIKAENTKVAEQKYNDILNKWKNLNGSTNPFEIQQGISELNDLFRYYTYHSTENKFDNNIYLAKKQSGILNDRLYNLKNDKEAESTRKNPMLYSGEFQEVGERDFLS